MNVLFIGKFGEKEAEKIIEESATIKCVNNNTNSKGGNDILKLWSNIYASFKTLV